MQGIGPADLKIDLLCERLERGEGEGGDPGHIDLGGGRDDAFLPHEPARHFEGVRITAIARGIGFGDELEYVDELTITHALLNRREIE